MATQEELTPVQHARGLLRQKKVAEAVKFLVDYLEQEPRDRSAHELLGMAYFMARHYTEAKAAFQQLTRVDPTYSPGWVNLGAVQNVLKEYQDATKSLRKGLQRDTKSASAYYNLGIAQKALKMNSMAINAYREAIKLNPEMEEPYINLANIYIEMTNLSQAIKIVDQGMKNCRRSKKLKAVWQKATDLQEGRRRSASPFGRLVNEEELANKQVSIRKRDLSIPERNAERDTLKSLAKAMRKAVDPMVQLMDEPLHNQLHVLSMAAAGKDARGDAPRIFNEMTSTLSEIDRLRSETTSAIAEIKAHLRQTDA